MLKPIPNELDLYRDTVTGKLINARGGVPFDTTHTLKGHRVESFIVQDNTRLILKRWGAVLQPWPDDLSADIVVSIAVQGTEIAAAPLFMIARTTGKKDALERRVERLEDILSASEEPQSIGALSDILVLEASRVSFHLDGPQNHIDRLVEQTEQLAFFIGGLRLKSPRG